MNIKVSKETFDHLMAVTKTKSVLDVDANRNTLSINEDTYWTPLNVGEEGEAEESKMEESESEAKGAAEDPEHNPTQPLQLECLETEKVALGELPIMAAFTLGGKAPVFFKIEWYRTEDRMINCLNSTTGQLFGMNDKATVTPLEATLIYGKI